MTLKNTDNLSATPITLSTSVSKAPAPLGVLVEKYPIAPLHPVSNDSMSFFKFSTKRLSPEVIRWWKASDTLDFFFKVTDLLEQVLVEGSKQWHTRLFFRFCMFWVGRFRVYNNPYLVCGGKSWVRSRGNHVLLFITSPVVRDFVNQYCGVSPIKDTSTEYLLRVLSSPCSSKDSFREALSVIYYLQDTKGLQMPVGTDEANKTPLYSNTIN